MHFAWKGFVIYNSWLAVFGTIVTLVLLISLGFYPFVRLLLIMYFQLLMKSTYTVH